jgi:hypothetical protein
MARGGLAGLHGGRGRGVAGGRAMVVLLACEEVSPWCVREGVGAGRTRFDVDCGWRRRYGGPSGYSGGSGRR